MFRANDDPFNIENIQLPQISTDPLAFLVSACFPSCYSLLYQAYNEQSAAGYPLLAPAIDPQCPVFFLKPSIDHRWILRKSFTSPEIIRKLSRNHPQDPWIPEEQYPLSWRRQQQLPEPHRWWSYAPNPSPSRDSASRWHGDPAVGNSSQIGMCVQLVSDTCNLNIPKHYTYY